MVIGVTRASIDIFRRKLLEWWLTIKKEDFPWRSTRDPYKILVAEIMLRKTDVNKVRAVYSAFIERFPDFSSLARAKEEEIIEFLKPLGIYRRRARQLKKIAEIVCSEYGGSLPRDLAAIMKLPGVGRYIANAVACFSWNERVPIVDVNVIRVLSRVFGLKVRKSAPHKDPKMWDFAKILLPPCNIREYNLALIDLGRTLCLAANPRCSECPLKDICNFVRREADKTFTDLEGC